MRLHLNQYIGHLSASRRLDQHLESESERAHVYSAMKNHLYSVFHFLMCEIKKIKGFLYKLHLVLF